MLIPCNMVDTGQILNLYKDVYDKYHRDLQLKAIYLILPIINDQSKTMLRLGRYTRTIAMPQRELDSIILSHNRRPRPMTYKK